jgi:CheY-like chemotaxis protein
MAEYDLPSGNQGEAWLIKAKNAVLRAKDLTQQLLTFSRGGAPITEPFSIGDFLKESASFALSGSNIRCEFFIPDDLQNIEADKGQINQVIHNIVLNAEQAMPDGGVIRVGAENRVVGPGSELPLQEGKFVKVFIEDHGHGISQNDLPRIFDPYFSTRERGSGLGLASAYSIVKRHGGHISVTSKVGVGTTFEVYLPASDKNIAVREEDKKGLVAGRGRILIMDDEEMVRELAGAILGQAGYEVENARDGSEAIDLYRRAEASGLPFDLVMMDLTIPGGMGGQEAIKRLRELDPDVRAIVSSGYSNDPVMAEYEKYGFKGVVVKPYTLWNLTRLIKDVLANPSD